MNPQEITLRVPGKAEYALVLRLTLGGVAILKDLDAGALDDLRNASDEAVDCLLHQGRGVNALTLTVRDTGAFLEVELCAEFDDTPGNGADTMETEISRAVLETLVPCVRMTNCECGCVRLITLTMNKAAGVEG